MVHLLLCVILKKRKCMKWIIKFYCLLLMNVSIFAQNENAFKAGEYLKYRVRYGVFNASFASLNVKNKNYEGKNLYQVTGKGVTTGLAKLFFKVDDTYESYFDKNTCKPYFFNRDIYEGGYTKKLNFFFNEENTLVKIKNLENNENKTISIVPETKDVACNANVTTLVSNANDVLYTTAKKETAERSPIVLGTVETPEGLNVLHLDADGNVRLAISPDGDGNKDYVQYRAVVLRNVKNMKAAVYQAEDAEFAQPIWTSTGAFSARKNHFDGRGKRSYLVDNTAWEGTDAKGDKVADGQYVYEVRYTPAVPGAEEQIVRFNLQIDTQKPLLTSGYTRTKDGVETFFARKPKDIGEGGILREQVFYVQAFDEEGTMVQKSLDAQGKTRSFENRVYLKANEDGSYTLPEGVSKEQLFYLV